MRSKPKIKMINSLLKNVKLSRGKEEAADRAMGDMDSSDDEQVGIQPDIWCPDSLVFNRISGVRTVWYSTGYPLYGQIGI